MRTHSIHSVSPENPNANNNSELLKGFYVQTIFERPHMYEVISSSIVLKGSVIFPPY